MRNRSNMTALLGLAPLVLLSACGGDTGGPSVRSGKTQEAPAAVRAAMCEGRATDAVARLTAEPLAGPADQFYTALAYEESGQPVHARQMYAGLMSAGYTDRVFLRCGNRILANGSVAEEAGKHLAMIARTLQAMDVVSAPARPLHAGLPPQQETGSTATAAVSRPATYSNRTMTVEKPESQSPLGRWFVHLASYRSIEHLQENKATLEKQFPALAGVLDQWEVTVKGNPAIRLGVRTSEKGEAQSLCDSIKRQGTYCAVLDTQ